MKKFLIGLVPLWSLLLPAMVEKPIVVIIPSYNNAEYVEKNLNSVYDQEYENYRVLYIDDCSPDTTLSMVQDIVARRGQAARTTIIHNDYNCGAVANFYYTIHQHCNDDDIVVQLDGDDWFKHQQVLARVNQEYHRNVWITYGRCEYYPNGKIDGQKRLPEGIVARSAYREYEKVPSHLRSFYAGLFKNIALQDFLYQGSFLKMNYDLAIMFPILEMARGKIGFIDEVLYCYNCATPLNDYKKDILLQLHLDHVLRSRDKYTPITSFYAEQQNVEPDVLILLSGQEDASLCKKSLKAMVSGLGHTEVLSSETTAEDLLTLLTALPSDYVFVVDAAMIASKSFDATLCTRALMQTKAHVFCCDRGVEGANDLVQNFVHVNNDLYGWQFTRGEYGWGKPFGSCAHIYAKKTLKNALSRFKQHKKGKDLFAALNDLIIDKDAVGLCFKESVVKDIYEK